MIKFYSCIVMKQEEHLTFSPKVLLHEVYSHISGKTSTLRFVTYAGINPWQQTSHLNPKPSGREISNTS